MRKNTFLQFAIVCLFVIIALGSSKSSNPSSSSRWEGSIGQQAVQHYVQGANGGKYVGNASSEAEAKRMAADKGYSGYNWYPSTGEVFGY